MCLLFWAIFKLITFVSAPSGDGASGTPGGPAEGGRMFLSGGSWLRVDESVHLRRPASRRLSSPTRHSHCVPPVSCWANARRRSSVCRSSWRRPSGPATPRRPIGARAPSQGTPTLPETSIQRSTRSWHNSDKRCFHILIYSCIYLLTFYCLT